MKNIFKNPFPKGDPDRRQLWEMLVKQDITAFCHQDWSMIAGDFIKDGFMGIDGRHLHNPDSWELTFPNLKSYKKEWLRQAREFAKTHWADDPLRAIYEATTLRDIEIKGKSALLHKKFDGYITKATQERVRLNWQTLYRCRKEKGRWKISGFIGYLPNPMGVSTS